MVTIDLQNCLQAQEVDSLALSADERFELGMLLLTGTIGDTVDLTQDSYQIMQDLKKILQKHGYDGYLRKQLKGCMEYPHINIRGMFNTCVGIRTAATGDREFVIGDKCSDQRIWKAVPLVTMNKCFVRTVLRIAATQAAHAYQVMNPLA